MYASHDFVSDAVPSGRRFGDGSPWLLLIYGFIYWFVIVAALEPGNLVNVLGSGASPHWGRELLRVLGAGLLGSVTVPAYVSLTRRFPVSHPHLWRNALIHLICAIAAATILITLAHVLASWFLDSKSGMTMSGFRDDLAANELLLVVGLTALSGLVHLAPSCLSPTIRPAPRSNGRATANGGYEIASKAPEKAVAAIETLEIKVRGVTTRLPVGEIDWVEAQGNYIALHVGDSALLLRETLASFEARLDPACFIRVHRRTIIAIDRIARVEPASNGDAVAWLRGGGQSLRVSRLYRKSLSGKMPV